MKRDMELIRQIAFRIEGSDGDIQSPEIEIENYTPAQIGYHCDLMHESGLIQATDIGDTSSEFAELHIFRLTSKGHDFIDAARSDTVWRKFMAKAKETGVAITIEMATVWLKQEGARLWGLGGTDAE